MKVVLQGALWSLAIALFGSAFVVAISIAVLAIADTLSRIPPVRPW
ncbi:MAG: hypothetical protein Q7S28_00830 [bacterium]|nr:hypothetical protein [bacterium]